MRALRRKPATVTEDGLFSVKRRKAPPFEFVLEAISDLAPTTRSMFGCLAVYVREKIVLILRDRQDHAEDNGIWLATTEEHHASLRRDFPAMRSIQHFARPVTSWQVLPAGAPDFEEMALRACELVVARDPRIGTIPGAKKSKRGGTRKKAG